MNRLSIEILRNERRPAHCILGLIPFAKAWGAGFDLTAGPLARRQLELRRAS